MKKSYKCPQNWRKRSKNSIIPTKNQYYKKQQKVFDYNNIVNQYLKTLLFYVKARSNVYIFAFATLTSLIIGSHGFANLNFPSATSAVIASYFMALAIYIYNDLTDFELDKINKTNRPFITGKATKQQLVVIIYFLNGIALTLTYFINFYAFFLSIMFITIGVSYSHPKVNLKEKFPLKTVLTATGAGLLSLLGGASALTATPITTTSGMHYSLLQLPIIYPALFFFAFFFILGPLGDIGDLKGDKAVGRRTFPIVLGIMPTVMMMLSIPVIVILMTMLLDYYYCYNNSVITGIHHMNVSGMYFIIGTCSATLIFILRISKKVNDTSAIKSMRPKMRFLHIMLQISLILVFI
jgi:geranylgeranylglycerol-phosphate geranylgeranyltransferase